MIYKLLYGFDTVMWMKEDNLNCQNVTKLNLAMFRIETDETFGCQLISKLPRELES